MNHAALRVTAVSGLALVGWVAGGALLAGAFALAGLGGVWLAACRHPNPALLPSVADADGHRLPARWCCHNCGATWPAAVEDGPVPVPRFAGFDERKAAESARRATDLERRQRELAVRRAGWAPKPETTEVRHAPHIKLERGVRPMAIRSRRAG
jgi:hypothetical protein